MALYVGGNKTGGWVKLQEYSIPATPSVSEVDTTWTNNNSFKYYKLIVTNLFPSGDGSDLLMRFYLGSWKTDYNYGYLMQRLSGHGMYTQQSYATNKITIHKNHGGTSGEGSNLTFHFHDPGQDGGFRKRLYWYGDQAEQSASRSEGLHGGGGYNNSSSPLTGIRIWNESYNLAKGTFQLWALLGSEDNWL